MHNWLLLELISMGPTVAKKKCINLLLPCSSLIVTNPNKKNDAHELDVKQKVNAKTCCCHNLKVWV